MNICKQRTLWKTVSVTMALVAGQVLFAQETDTIDNNGYKAVKIGYEIIDGDTISSYLFNKFLLKSTQTPQEKKQFRTLVQNVRKALPYAKLAAFRLQLMEDNLNMLTSEKAKKKYIKECEKAIKKEFMDDLQNMTQDQGKILLKLIHRETGKTTWDIMKNYRGGLETLFWQSVAKMYNADMHDTYDPVVDYQIESIIKSFEIEDMQVQ